MKNLKFLLVAFAITMSTSVFANSSRFINTESVTSEVEKVLNESYCDLQEDLSVTLFFSVSENGRIQSLEVASGNEEVDQLLKERLEDQEVPGDYWRKGKIYELSVVQKARK
ncbi:hypothetical protein [Salinimicrobium soli]|uniref:hypothetical protein n=1 Tax=Salinimicrobium soli TaxID=1254399 RepID=UPI003AAF8CCB